MGAIIRHHARLAEEQFGAGNIKQIACGVGHTVVLLNTGDVYVCGYNSNGQLGIGNTTQQSSFIKSTTLPAGAVVESVACGSDHTVVKLNMGDVYVCGLNNRGQLGIGNITNQKSFVKVSTLPAGSIAGRIACGYYHTAVTLNTGEVYLCGYNSNGQLGIGSTTQQNSFIKSTTLPVDSVAQNVTCGSGHTVVLLNTGDVYVCGYNSNGQLGIGNTTQQSSFIKSTTLPAGAVVESVACGGFHTAVLLQTGDVYVCGYNGYGQLGIGNTTQQSSFIKSTTLPAGAVVESVACGGNRTLVLMGTGEVYACGLNTSGQLGIGSTASPQTSFVKVTTLPAGSIAENICCSNGHTFVILNTGNVYACGENTSGQLGIGSTASPKPSFVESIPTWEEAA